MGKFDGVLLISDFDDTLCGQTYRIPERNLRALDYFMGEGGRFTVATGRAHRTFAPYYHLLPINAPVVLSNGAAIFDFKENRYLEESLLGEHAAPDFGELMERFPTLGMEAYHGEDIYVCNPNQVTYGHLKKVNCGYTLSPVAQMPTPWCKVLLQQERDVLLSVRDYILGRWGDRYEAIFSNRYYLEVTHKGCTKGGMVDRLVQHLGIDPAHVY